MALNGITFETLDGQLGRTLAGEDATSGLILPVLQTAGAVSGVFYSIDDAEAKGITLTAEPQAHFVISTYFEQVAAPLYVLTTSGSYATDVDAIQSMADGEIRQLAVLDDVFDFAQVAVLDTAAKALEVDSRGLSIVYAGSAGAGLTFDTLPSLVTADHSKVSVVASLDAATGFSCIGATLGTIAFASVAENIGYVRKFNVVKNTAFDLLKFFTGEDYRSVSTAKKTALKNKGYIFLTKYTGFSGSFHSDSNTAALPTSDYKYIENVRTVEKAIRGLRVSLLPEVMSNLATNGGKLSVPTIARFELLCENVLNAMKNSQELSNYTVVIDPNQNVLANSELKIQVGITPLGVSRQIKVKIGFQL